MSPWIQAAPVTAAVTITSEPPGADVIVGDKRFGETPAQIELPAGDHRIRLVKGGYLENSRMVSVRPGQSNGLDVRLTPHRGIHKQVEGGTTTEKKEEGGGGGGSKWLFLGLGAAAVGGGAYYFLTKNSAPNAGTIGVSPTGTGMAGVTNFTFRADGASDPDNDPLTFEWSFGDGSTGSGQSVTKVFSSPGTYSVTLTVRDKKHKVDAPAATVTVARSLAGTWTGGLEPGFDCQFRYDLQQSGTNLTGSMVFTGNCSGSISITGTVNGTTHPASTTINTPVYGISGTSCGASDRFSGSTDSSGNSMSGTLTVTLTGGCTFRSTGTPTASGQVTLRR